VLLISSYLFCCELLQGEVGIVLELPNQKARVFSVPIAVTRWFPKHVRRVLGEMSVRT
jgi:hypothetical protein